MTDANEKPCYGSWGGQIGYKVGCDVCTVEEECREKYYKDYEVRHEPGILNWREKI